MTILIALATLMGTAHAHEHPHMHNHDHLKSTVHDHEHRDVDVYGVYAQAGGGVDLAGSPQADVEWTDGSSIHQGRYTAGTVLDLGFGLEFAGGRVGTFLTLGEAQLSDYDAAGHVIVGTLGLEGLMQVTSDIEAGIFLAARSTVWSSETADGAYKPNVLGAVWGVSLVDWTGADILWNSRAGASFGWSIDHSYAVGVVGTTALILRI